MTHASAGRPEPNEYAAYFSKYLNLAPEEGDIVAGLEKQRFATLECLRDIDEQKSNHRYAADKWSIKEVIGHVIDTERVFSYRAFYFGRNNQNPVAGYDQDITAQHANHGLRSFSDILDEYEVVRQASLHVFRNFDKDAWMRRGIANNNEISVRALAYVILGHERHHLEILKTRYLAQ